MIDAVVPDYYARLPKPCVGGWGRRSLNVTPSGKVLPCHAAEVDPGTRVLERPRPFARRHLDAFAGLQRVPRHRLDAGAVRKLPERREIDFGGCRCQAFLLTGDAARDRPGLPSVPARTTWSQHRRSASEAQYVYRRMYRLPSLQRQLPDCLRGEVSETVQQGRRETGHRFGRDRTVNFQTGRNA